MIFASDLSVPEGPVLLPDGSWLVVEMGPGRGLRDARQRRMGRPSGGWPERDVPTD